MKSLITESCTRFGIRLKDVRFLFDGQRVLFNSTPEEFDMEEVQDLPQKSKIWIFRMKKLTFKRFRKYKKSETKVFEIS
jgi:hypothetical protein